jgi:hypothetical protein
MGPSKSWYVAALVRLGSLNCCENIDTNLIGKLLVVRTGDHGHSFQFHRAVASRLMHSWAVRCHGIRAQVWAPTYRCPLLHDPSCQLPQLPLPRRPRSPTLRPFSTLPSNHTNVKPRATYPLIPSFPAFNPANPPRLSSPSLETKSPQTTNLKVPTTGSQNGLPQL